MNNAISQHDRAAGALYGLFIGDALAMPVHWYYDTQALQRDYGEVTGYLQPQGVHPDSILWRSSYRAPAKSADILHEQAQYWGLKGVHYHQFLQAGENTLNVKLARELLLLIQHEGAYHRSSWLERMIAFLTTPGNHKDTYVEEYLRYFFSRYGAGETPEECGRDDEHHIGGYSLMLPLVIAYAESPDYAKRVALEHLSLTHGGSKMKKWGGFLTSMLLGVLQGNSIRESILTAETEHNVDLNVRAMDSWKDYSDTIVVGKHFSSACYVDQAVPATIFLALKYSDSPEKGLIANTMCGGDNAGRGAVLGAILGAANGQDGWPSRWKDLLLHPPPVVQLRDDRAS